MCGRAATTSSSKKLVEAFKLAKVIAGPERPDYNLPPTREIPAVVNDGRMELNMLRWGLVPSWAKELKGLPLMNNARAETLTEKRTFKIGLEKRRCIVLVDGFYEWKKVGKEKLPFFIHRRDGQPLAFAGLWEVWQQPDQPHVLTSCTVITCAANQTMSPIHDRMPVILGQEEISAWLRPERIPPEELTPLLRPCGPEILDLYQVAPLVNSVKNNQEALLLPIGEKA